MTRYMTATEIIERQKEWHAKWAHVPAVLNDLAQKILDGLIDRLSRHDKAGWPTRGETVDEC